MTAEDLKLATALWGAVTGTVGSSLAIYLALRDRSRLRINIVELERTDAEKILPDAAKLNTEQCVFVEVVNAGRRVKYIYAPELWVTSDHLLIPQQVDRLFANGIWAEREQPWQSWRLEEGQTVTFVFCKPTKYIVVRVDLPDTLARTRKEYQRMIGGRVRWFYGRWKGRVLWKEMREASGSRVRTRHHNED